MLNVIVKTGVITPVALCLLACASGGQVYEERITESHGIVEACGEGAGLDPCRDASGETYAEEMDPESKLRTESNEEMAEESARLRGETNEEFNEEYE